MLTISDTHTFEVQSHFKDTFHRKYSEFAANEKQGRLEK